MNPFGLRQLLLGLSLAANFAGSLVAMDARRYGPQEMLGECRQLVEDIDVLRSRTDGNAARRGEMIRGATKLLEEKHRRLLAQKACTAGQRAFDKIVLGQTPTAEERGFLRASLETSLEYLRLHKRVFELYLADVSTLLPAQEALYRSQLADNAQAIAVTEENIRVVKAMLAHPAGKWRPFAASHAHRASNAGKIDSLCRKTLYAGAVVLVSVAGMTLALYSPDALAEAINASIDYLLVNAPAAAAAGAGATAGAYATNAYLGGAGKGAIASEFLRGAGEGLVYGVAAAAAADAARVGLDRLPTPVEGSYAAAAMPHVHRLAPYVAGGLGAGVVASADARGLRAKLYRTLFGAGSGLVFGFAYEALVKASMWLELKQASVRATRLGKEYQNGVAKAVGARDAAKTAASTGAINARTAADAEFARARGGVAQGLCRLNEQQQALSACVADSTGVWAGGPASLDCSDLTADQVADLIAKARDLCHEVSCAEGATECEAYACAVPLGERALTSCKANQDNGCSAKRTTCEATNRLARERLANEQHACLSSIRQRESACLACLENTEASHAQEFGAPFEGTSVEAFQACCTTAATAEEIGECLGKKADQLACQQTFSECERTVLERLNELRSPQARREELLKQLDAAQQQLDSTRRDIDETEGSALMAADAAHDQSAFVVHTEDAYVAQAPETWADWAARRAREARAVLNKYLLGADDAPTQGAVAQVAASNKVAREQAVARAAEQAREERLRDVREVLAEMGHTGSTAAESTCPAACVQLIDERLGARVQQ